MRTVKEPEIRKQEILDGAIRIFAEKGYDRATISTIAKELKISQGLCYRYFASKEEIYDAAVEKYADLIMGEFLKFREEEASVKERIDNIARSIGQLTSAERKNGDLYEFFHGEHGDRLHNELLLRIASKLLPYIQEMLCSAKEKGEISVEDPERTAILGLYGELGVFFVKEMTEKERMETIQMGWKRLLG